VNHQLRSLLALPVATLLLLACGDDVTTDDATETAPAATDEHDDHDDTEPADDDADDTSDGTEDTTEVDEATDADEEATEDLATGELGTVTVDGTSYVVERVIVCDPDEDAGFDRDLELQAIGDADGARTQLDVVLGGILPVDVSWAGPEGIFGMGEAGTAAADHDGDQLTGTASLEDPFGEGETVELTFDVVVPDDTTSCR
jgi:hypothetical protein